MSSGVSTRGDPQQVRFPTRRFKSIGWTALIQSLRAVRRAGKGANRKVVSDGHGARVEGKGGMGANAEGPSNGARVKGMERSKGNIQQKIAESASKNFIAEHRAAQGEPWGGGFGHFRFTLGSLSGSL